MDHVWRKWRGAQRAARDFGSLTHRVWVCSIASVVANIDTFLAAEAKLVALARRYGWAHLSYHDALAAGLRDGVHTKLGWSVCEARPDRVFAIGGLITTRSAVAERICSR